jgi:hypothetical protein
LDELAKFVTTNVRAESSGRQNPVFDSPFGLSSRIVVGPNAKFTKTIVVAIGNSRYTDKLRQLLFPAKDAQDFAAFWQRHGAETVTRIDATRNQTIEAIREVSKRADSGTLELIYYSGHAVTLKNGTVFLMPVDADVDQPDQTGISTLDIRSLLLGSPAELEILFIDAAFSSALLETTRWPDTMPLTGRFKMPVDVAIHYAALGLRFAFVEGFQFPGVHEFLPWPKRRTDRFLEFYLEWVNDKGKEGDESSARRAATLGAGSPSAPHGYSRQSGGRHESRINFSELQVALAAGGDGAFSNPVRRAKYCDFCFLHFTSF